MRTRPAALVATLALAGLLAACGNGDEGLPLPDEEASELDTVITDTDDEDTVAIVNDRAITRADLFTYAGMDEDPGVAAQGEGVLDEVISLELLRQEALKRGLGDDPEIQRILKMVETNLLASTLMERIAEELEISEEEVEAEYERQVEYLRGTEYRARHILVGDEDSARELLAQLDDGADFAELAEEHSIDPGSAARGGDLGWFTPDGMVPEFAAATEALEPGETTDAPVQSQFGWHLIRLDDTREVEVPPLDEVRAEIIEILESRAIQEKLEDLRAKATIEIPNRPEN
ncbi:peptidylprolyl isomerase [Thioalkalivibrio thiocyanoxidans]|uniref:peptidylprolyl isomerase n=1 Tax=Thioalkalivibrio thiocyanoxidans TaxID=152475 RepID=UPI0003A1DDCD|nr:peptidylprolyl isomerase [Thioalkalivibrio thiocyanoxidans]